LERQAPGDFTSPGPPVGYFQPDDRERKDMVGKCCIR
jgi:hypothetical protein